MLLKLIFSESRQEEEQKELIENQPTLPEESILDPCLQLTPLTDEEMRHKRKKRIDMLDQSLSAKETDTSDID